MVEKNTVSAIVTTFNRNSSIVERALLSIINQTYKVTEIIVVDDNKIGNPISKDIEEMCRKYDLVRYIKMEGNKGACIARNTGLNNSNCEFIGFLDDDDEWLPSKIEKQINCFKENNAITGIVFCNGLVRFEPSNERKSYIEESVFKTNVKFQDMLEGDKIGSTSHPLIKKSCFDAVGLFWESQPARQDYEMWLRITEKYDAVGINEKLFVHTIHDGEQISKNKKKCYLGYKNIYKRYKSHYKKNSIANDFIISCLFSNIYCFSFFNVHVIFSKFVSIIKRILKRYGERKNES